MKRIVSVVCRFFYYKKLSLKKFFKDGIYSSQCGNRFKRYQSGLEIPDEQRIQVCVYRRSNAYRRFYRRRCAFFGYICRLRNENRVIGYGFARILFSEDEQLYDRCIFLHTTFIPYREFEEVLGIKGIDEYICYGGTMSLGGVHYNEKSTFANKKSVDEYVDSAIAKNIQHSLKCYQYGGHFRALYDLYEKGELTSAINRVVEDVNHRFTLDVLTKDFMSHDFGISVRNLRNDRQNQNDILDRIDKAEFTKRLKNLLEIRNREEQKMKISDEHRREIKEYLDALDLTVDIDIQTLPVDREKNFKTVFTQPGMRYSQAKELVQSSLEDGEFQELSIDERNAVIERILSDIKGRMMEDIVLLETKIANPKKQVFQLQFVVGEFDMVVADNANATCEIYEVKHSKEQAKEQFRHLIDEEKLKNTEFRYGKITKRTVIYRGENATLENGIEYRNVEDYLKSLL